MPNRHHLHISRNAGERIADSVTGYMGSWKFVLIQSAIVLVWILGNLWFLSRPYDPFPFILLNLVFSTQAAYASPLILMSQNRTAARDKARDDLESSEVQSLYDSHALLLQINQQQLEILTALRKQAGER